MGCHPSATFSNSTYNHLKLRPIMARIFPTKSCWISSEFRPQIIMALHQLLMPVTFRITDPNLNWDRKGWLHGCNGPFVLMGWLMTWSSNSSKLKFGEADFFLLIPSDNLGNGDALWSNGYLLLEKLKGKDLSGLFSSWTGTCQEYPLLSLLSETQRPIDPYLQNRPTHSFISGLKGLNVRHCWCRSRYWHLALLHHLRAQVSYHGGCWVWLPGVGLSSIHPTPTPHDIHLLWTDASWVSLLNYIISALLNSVKVGEKAGNDQCWVCPLESSLIQKKPTHTFFTSR